MSFDEFENCARLYVIGALDGVELEEAEHARKKFGQKAEDFLGECYVLHQAFALSLQPAKSSEALKERLMSMVRERKRGKETVTRAHARKPFTSAL